MLARAVVSCEGLCGEDPISSSLVCLSAGFSSPLLARVSYFPAGCLLVAPLRYLPCAPLRGAPHDTAVALPQSERGQSKMTQPHKEHPSLLPYSLPWKLDTGSSTHPRTGYHMNENTGRWGLEMTERCNSFIPSWAWESSSIHGSNKSAVRRDSITLRVKVH